MIAGKCWGQTEPLIETPFCELHRIEVKPGGTCSKHMHRYKYNWFYVDYGQMEVKVWKNDYDLVDVTKLERGQSTIVKPGEYHQFYCVGNCVAYELYWSLFDPTDIVRETCGHA